MPALQVRGPQRREAECELKPSCLTPEPRPTGCAPDPLTLTCVFACIVCTVLDKQADL